MLTTEMKNSIDDICEAAPVMSMVVNPVFPQAAAFCVAKDLLRDGEVDAALSLLENYPDSRERVQKPDSQDDFLTGLLNTLESEEG